MPSRSRNPILQTRRQGLVGAGAVSEEGLALAPGAGDDRIEERDVGWRAAEALVGVPASPVGKLDRQSAVFGAGRVGRRRRLAVAGGAVAEHVDLAHPRVDHVRLRQGPAIILHLTSEEPAEPHQQLGFPRDRMQAGKQEQAARAVERIRQERGLRLERRSSGAAHIHIRGGKRNTAPKLAPGKGLRSKSIGRSYSTACCPARAGGASPGARSQDSWSWLPLEPGSTRAAAPASAASGAPGPTPLRARARDGK